MWALKVYYRRTQVRLYLLQARSVGGRIHYAGAARLPAGIDRMLTRVAGARQTVIQLHRGMQAESVWNFGLESHDTVGELLSGLPKAPLVELAPAHVLMVLQQAMPVWPEEAELAARCPTLWPRLKPYQQDGVRFVVSREGRTLLADDMGLGKTWQALAVLEFYQNESPTLVLCPAAVMATWQAHVAEYLPSRHAHMIRTWQDDFNVEPSAINILSYGMLGSAKFAGKRNAFQPVVMVVDESHYVKNGRAKRTKVVFGWSKRARRVLLMTGTPLNRPIELYSQVKCVDRTLFPRLYHYRPGAGRDNRILSGMPDEYYYAARYCRPELTYTRHNSVMTFRGSENESELYALLKHRLMLRRTKAQVLPQLPPKSREVVYLEPTDPKKLGQPADKVISFSNDSEFMELVRATAQEKLAPALHYYRSIVGPELEMDPHLKVLVWAHHHFMLDALRELFEELLGDATAVVAMDGRTSNKARQTSVARFQDPSDPARVAVLGQSAMCTGVTLTAATLELFTELAFTPDIHEQAEDRACRIGQHHPVTIRILACPHSTDVVLLRMLNSKTRVASMALDNIEAHWQVAPQTRLKRPRVDLAGLLLDNQ